MVVSISVFWCGMVEKLIGGPLMYRGVFVKCGGF